MPLWLRCATAAAFFVACGKRRKGAFFPNAIRKIALHLSGRKRFDKVLYDAVFVYLVPGRKSKKPFWVGFDFGSQHFVGFFVKQWVGRINGFSGFSIPKTCKEIVGHFNRFNDLLQLDSHFLKISLNGQCFSESLCSQRRNPPRVSRSDSRYHLPIRFCCGAEVCP